MAKAPPFPDAWGFDQLIGANKTDILNASITAWKNAGKELNASGLPVHPESVGMGAVMVFGMLPFVFGTLVYIRTQKLVPTTFTMLLTTAGLHTFQLIEGPFLYALYLVTVFSFAFSLLYTFWNKE